MKKKMKSPVLAGNEYRKWRFLQQNVIKLQLNVSVAQPLMIERVRERDVVSMSD